MTVYLRNQLKHRRKSAEQKSELLYAVRQAQVNKSWSYHSIIGPQALYRLRPVSSFLWIWIVRIYTFEFCLVEVWTDRVWVVLICFRGIFIVVIRFLLSRLSSLILNCRNLNFPSFVFRNLSCPNLSCRNLNRPKVNFWILVLKSWVIGIWIFLKHMIFFTCLLIFLIMTCVFSTQYLNIS